MCPVCKSHFIEYYGRPKIKAWKYQHKKVPISITEKSFLITRKAKCTECGFDFVSECEVNCEE